jgi:hypothetical protein
MILNIVDIRERNLHYYLDITNNIASLFQHCRQYRYKNTIPQFRHVY